jgi:hypothetical protein
MTDADPRESYTGIDRLFRHCSMSPNRLRWPWVVTMIVLAFVLLFLLLNFLG